jgi:hypothetical protein
MKASLKTLVPSEAAAPAPAPERAENRPSYRTAQTRTDTRQVSGHFKPDVAHTLRLIAVEQDRDIQEILAEALNMVFARYGKATRAEVTSGRRKPRDA